MEDQRSSIFVVTMLVVAGVFCANILKGMPQPGSNCFGQCGCIACSQDVFRLPLLTFMQTYPVLCLCALLVSVLAAFLLKAQLQRYAPALALATLTVLGLIALFV
jgi:hypothetical protein